jgi:hypothetical protein
LHKIEPPGERQRARDAHRAPSYGLVGHFKHPVELRHWKRPKISGAPAEPSWDPGAIAEDGHTRIISAYGRQTREADPLRDIDFVLTPSHFQQLRRSNTHPPRSAALFRPAARINISVLSAASSISISHRHRLHADVTHSLEMGEARIAIGGGTLSYCVQARAAQIEMVAGARNPFDLLFKAAA